MNDQGNCHRDRFARLLQDISDPWVVDMLPVLIRIVAVVRRFFAAAGDSRVGVSFGADSPSFCGYWAVALPNEFKMGLSRTILT